MALNVLIVDDSATMRSMVARMLTMSGLPVGKVHQAGNGKEGIEMLEREWVDIVFADINMPVLSGLDMIRYIREHPHLDNLPIVVISTESSEERIKEVQRLGVQFIHKPFTPEQVRAVVQSMLGGLPNATA
ncbi:MAG TPA: response regulator [Phycisphaerae bacterium]|nr:response regulator [Phycisphaerae bacterium]